MRGSFARIVLTSGGLFALAGAAFVAVLVRLGAGSAVMTASLTFIAIATGLFAGYMLAIRRRMNMILARLSDTVQSLHADEPFEPFEPAQDTMLSKLQEQIVGLSALQRAQQARFRRESEQVKSLLSDIAHQLKTPLANLRMYAGMLLDARLQPEKRAAFSRTMMDQTEKLAWLTEGLIKMSRLESGIVAIRAERGYIGDTVLTAIKQTYPIASEKGVELRFEGEGRIELLHDAKWTAEAIGNLLDNAVKYGGGIVVIGIQRYELFVRIDVRDDGPGIPERERSRIFARFYRGANARDAQGVGIGLYLTRKIVTDQGGYMKVESKHGEGSRFSIFLPVD